MRPVLDSYKAEGGGNVLQVFKAKQVSLPKPLVNVFLEIHLSVQALLLEQEEREREERKRLSQKSGSRFGGQFSTFSLGTGLSGQKNTPSPPLPPPPSSTSSPPHSPPASVAGGSSETDDSWTSWIGSWIGWK